MLYKKLSDIADVQSGLVLSRKESKLDSEQVIEYRNLNLRSISDDGSISEDALEIYLADEKLESQFISAKENIIIRLFPPFQPALITESSTGLVIPSQFAIVRLRSNLVLPKFLYYYLAHAKLLESLAIRGSGKISGGIKISALSEMKIPIPDLDKQRAVANYSEINTIQKQLYSNLIQQYELKMDAVMNKVIGGV